MRVCDRCKKELDTQKETKLAGEEFELCLSCAEVLAKHIRTYKKGKLSQLFNG